MMMSAATAVQRKKASRPPVHVAETLLSKDIVEGVKNIHRRTSIPCEILLPYYHSSSKYMILFRIHVSSGSKVQIQTLDTTPLTVGGEEHNNQMKRYIQNVSSFIQSQIQTQHPLSISYTDVYVDKKMTTKNLTPAESGFYVVHAARECFSTGRIETTFEDAKIRSYLELYLGKTIAENIFELTAVWGNEDKSKPCLICLTHNRENEVFHHHYSAHYLSSIHRILRVWCEQCEIKHENHTLLKYTDDNDGPLYIMYGSSSVHQVSPKPHAHKHVLYETMSGARIEDLYQNWLLTWGRTTTRKQQHILVAAGLSDLLRSRHAFNNMQDVIMEWNNKLHQRNENSTLRLMEPPCAGSALALPYDSKPSPELMRKSKNLLDYLEFILYWNNALCLLSPGILWGLSVDKDYNLYRIKEDWREQQVMDFVHLTENLRRAYLERCISFLFEKPTNKECADNHLEFVMCGTYPFVGLNHLRKISLSMF